MSLSQACSQQTVEYSYVRFTHHINARMYALLHHLCKVIHRLFFIYHSHKHCLLIANYCRLWSIVCALRVDVHIQHAVFSLSPSLYCKTVAPSSLLDYDGIGVVACHFCPCTLIYEFIVLIKCISRLKRHFAMLRLFVFCQFGYSHHQFVVVADAHGLLYSRLHLLLLGDVEVVEPV